MNDVPDELRSASEHPRQLWPTLREHCTVRTVALAVALALAGYCTAFQIIESRQEGAAVNHEPAVGQASGQVITAAENELRNERLSDGSVVAMSPGTRMQVDFSGPRRLVNMQRGIAQFTVKKNVKPFTVQTPLMDVTAVGTSFSVSAGACSRVEVHEGVVQIAVRGTKGGLERTLTVGQSLDWPYNCSGLVLAEFDKSNSAMTGK